MATFLATIKSDFDSALNSKDVEQLESVLNRFDESCKTEIESEADILKKEVLIKQCITLHKQIEADLLKARHEIREQIHSAKTNGKKINKYLNV
ncbi:hypothetical protein GCM10009128_06540 [Psychrosphaera haliotis]|uniref:hypothetical protein n=1 Tax=Psychrosphaera haliotis TaxID=555083 RepID=UPI0031CFF9E6